MMGSQIAFNMAKEGYVAIFFCDVVLGFAARRFFPLLHLVTQVRVILHDWIGGTILLDCVVCFILRVLFCPPGKGCQAVPFSLALFCVMSTILLQYVFYHYVSHALF